MHTDKEHFTKAERILARLLQENRISFITKQKIGGREIDFLIGKIAIEVDGHEQDEEKNNLLIKLGYYPMHFHNKEIYSSRQKVVRQILNLCQLLN